MPVPLAPKPISPIAGVGARIRTATFRARNNATDANHVTAFLLERQRLSPTLGSVEYYNASVGGGTFVASAPAQSDTIDPLEGGETWELVKSTFDWTPDAIYQWRVKFQNTWGWSPYSPWSTFVARESVGVSFGMEAGSSDSRPVIRFEPSTPFGGDAEAVGFSFIVWEQSVVLDPLFNRYDPGWQSLAVWAMDDFESYGPTIQKRVGADLVSGTVYTVYGKILDRYGIDHGYSSSGTITVTLTPPDPPSVSAVPDPANGIMRVTVDGSFNLADIESAAFETSVGLWESADNAELEWASHVGGVETRSTRVTTTGATYAQMDTAHGTHANADTAYATHEDQRLVRTAFTGGARIWYGGAHSVWIPAVAAQNYSAIISLYPEGFSTTAELILRFYTAAGAFISESTKVATSCPGNVWTEVSIGSVASPANTAFIRPTLEIFDGVDDVVYIDNFAVARSSEVVWSPGGSSADARFNLARKVGSGDWEYVWGASRDNPKVPATSVYSVVEIEDRAYPIGTDETVMYRAVIVSEATGKAVASAATDIVAPSLDVEAWWLRCVDGSLPDVRLRAFSFSKSYEPSNMVIPTQGQDYSTIVDSGDAPGQSIRVSANLFNVGEYSAMEALLTNKKMLYIQRNIGDGFYIKPTGGVQMTQRVAKATDGRVRHFHQASFNAEIVAKPEDL